MSCDESNDSINANASEMTNEEIKSKIMSGVFKISKKRGRSRVWNTFGKIEIGSGEELSNLVGCRNCKNIYKYNSNSTSNLIKHKCYSIVKTVPKIVVDNESKIKLTQAIAEWTVENCRAFQLVADSGFKKVAEKLIEFGKTFGSNVEIEHLLPEPTTVSKNVNQVYDIFFKKIKNEIATIKNNEFGLTSDLWTDNFLKTTYVALTIHYIKERGDIVSRFLGMKCLEGEICTKNITLQISNILHEFDLELDDNALIVTGSNMAASFRYKNHMVCINHLLSCILQKSIEEITDVANLSRECSELVQYFKLSDLSSNLNTTLKGFSLTRWNTIYYGFLSIKENWAEIIQILEQENQMKRVSKISINVITALIKILEEFEKTSKMLEGENYPTIHLVYVYIYKLKKICSANTADIEMIKHFKEKLWNYLDSIVFKNLSIYHKIALFLFPPLNAMIKLSEDEKQLVIRECQRLMKNYQDQQEEHQPEPVEIITGTSNENTALFSDFMPPTEVCTAIDNIDNINLELSSYQDTKTSFHDEFNILQWWDLHKNEFPLLFKVSHQVLATPASIASLERTFSAGRNLISENALNNCSINQIIFLHSNLQEDELQNTFNVQNI